MENKKNQESKAKKSFFKKVLLFLYGGVVGIINGFFGGGGGTIGVPILEKSLGVDNKTAHATCIALILPLSIISSAVYVCSKTVENSLLLSVGSGVLFGGILGSWLLKFLPSKIVRIVFCLVLFAGGIRLILW